MIVDHVKSDASNRRIYLTKDAMDIIPLQEKQLRRNASLMKIISSKIAVVVFHRDQ